MSALQLAAKARAIQTSNPVAYLYRSIVKEVPRVLIIYDIDMDVNDAKAKIRELFYNHAHLKDKRVKSMLVERGYMDLEETLLQYKQKNHLLKIFTGYVDDDRPTRKRLQANATPWEEFARE